jgi:hypothetical protein
MNGMNISFDEPLYSGRRESEGSTAGARGGRGGGGEYGGYGDSSYGGEAESLSSVRAWFFCHTTGWIHCI